MKRRCRTGLMGLLSLGIVSLLPAASFAVGLSSVDLGLNVGALTRDSSTGLDWLDLSFTLGMSPGEAAGFGNVFEGGGFRYATLEEFQTLLQSAEVAWTDGVYRWYGQAPAGVFDPTLASAIALLEQLGVTADFSTGGTADWRAVGWLGYPGATGIAEIDLYKPYASTMFGVSTGFRSEDPTAYTTVGSFMVREGQQGTGETSPPPVPEPGTLLLLGSGLLGIAGGARRRLRS